MESERNKHSCATVAPVHVAIGIMAWNEEDSVEGLIKSLAAQTIFGRLGSDLRCEIILVANGCKDKTCAVAEKAFSETFGASGTRDGFSWRVIDLPQPGKLNAWNKFVHSFSSPEANYFILMDVDIRFDEAETLWSMVQTLVKDRTISVAVDIPKKKAPLTRIRALSLPLTASVAQVTALAPGQICGQLYAIRGEIVRNIYMPRDLPACDDGFIKALVCTDFLKSPLDPGRIRIAPSAGHFFEAYTAPGVVLRNQKRQIIAQTVAHLLIDKYLPTLSVPEKTRLAETLVQKDQNEPDWLRFVIARHLASIRWPWQLYPRLLTHRFVHIRGLTMRRRLQCIPGLLAGMAVALVASCMAYRTLKSGSIMYWPKASRDGLEQLVEPVQQGKLKTKLIQ